MPIREFEMHPHGLVEIVGDIPAESDTTGNALKGFVLSINHVKKNYDEQLADDGRLVGQERFALRSAIDEALCHAVALRRALTGQDDFTAIAIKYDYRLRFQIEGRKWKGRGPLGKFRKLKHDDFKLWLNRLRQERIVNLIKFLGQALADGKIDSRESIILHRAVDRLIFSLVIVRDGIAHADLS